MQSRRDQLQAYRFLTRRALAALVTGEPDVQEAPMRRLALITCSGIMIAVLVAAGFGLYGLIKPGTTSKWKKDGTIVVERETGATYVYYSDELHPTLNYASAVLASGNKNAPDVQLVARSSLAGIRRSRTIGIDGAPDSLPSTAKLLTGPWTVCSQITQPAADENVATVSLSVGSDAGSVRLAADRGVAVTTTDGSASYLLWHGQRLQITTPAIAAALDLGSAQPLTVGSALLNALPQGTAFRTPVIPGAGSVAARRVDGRSVLVGQLLHIADQQKYAVMLADGVHDVTPVEASLLRTLALAGTLRPPVETNQTSVLNLPQAASWSSVSQQFGGLPDAVPPLDATAVTHGGVCAIYDGRSAAPALAASNETISAVEGKVTESGRSRQGVADAVSVLPGHAAIVQADNGSATVFFVTDDPGKKFPLGQPAADVLSAFGYGSVKPVRLPAQLLLMLPTGPALDPTAARTPVS